MPQCTHYDHKLALAPCFSVPRTGGQHAENGTLSMGTASHRVAVFHVRTLSLSIFGPWGGVVYPSGVRCRRLRVSKPLPPFAGFPRNFIRAVDWLDFHG